MIPTKQIAVLFLLVGGAVTVWVPKVRNALSGAEPNETQGSDGVTLPIGDGSQPAITVSVDTPPIVPRATSTEADSVETSGGKATHPSSESSTAEDPALRNFGSKGRSLLLRKPKSTAEDEPTPMLESNHLQLWIIEHPLTGVMRSSRGNRAIFGGGFFAEGQELVDGWTLEVIHPEFVEVKGHGMTHSVQLPRLGAGLERQSQDEFSEGTQSSQSSAPAQSNDPQSENN